MDKAALNILKASLSILCLSVLTQQTSNAAQTPCGSPLSTRTEIAWEKGNNPWDNVPKDSHRIEISRGWKIPNAHTWIILGGMVKIDGIHDMTVPSGDPGEWPTLAVKSSISNRMNHNTRFTARQSNFDIGTVSETKIGDVKSYLAADFSANNYFGDYSNRHNISVNSIGLRLREAFVEVNGFLFGQTTTTFSDKESDGYTLVHNGVTGNNQLRQSMIRYTWYNPFTQTEKKSNRIMLSLESPITDYTQYNGTRAPGGGTNGTIALPDGTTTPLLQAIPLENDTRVAPLSRGVSPLPDLVGQIRFEKKGVGHIAIRGVARYLTIRPDTVTTVKKFGWGGGISARFFFTNYNSVFFNYNAGNGIGRYIYDLPNSSLVYNAITKASSLQFAQGLIAGIEHYWTDHIRSNVIVGLSQVNNAKFLKDLARSRSNIPADRTSTDQIGQYKHDVAFVNHRMQHVTVNLIYKPTKAIETGIEYNHVRRTTITGQNGVGKRFQVSCIYRF